MRGFTLIELLVVIAVISILITLLVPSLTRAKEQTQTSICLNNLRLISVAARTYTERYEGYYPVAYYYRSAPPRFISAAWDFTTTKDWGTGKTVVAPGILWEGSGSPKVQQCPSFTGSSSTYADPYSGYNYNTSYVGHGSGESIPAPARIDQIKSPGQCAVFGDGEYAGGANKFMRAPWSNPGDASFSARSAGTQGYRHLRGTNVAFCDGHAVRWTKRCTDTYDGDRENIAPNTGFLSSDNSMYDLE